MILNENFTLSNKVEIPKLGLGTWFISNGDAPQAVRDAVEAGYRHIDTAQAYRNESGVGEGVRSCGLKREDIFCNHQAWRGDKVIQKSCIIYKSFACDFGA